MQPLVISQASSQSSAVIVDEDAHQFGDGHGGMGVVQLDRHLVGERAHLVILLHVAADDVLQRGGGEEIFLPQPQLLARPVSSRTGRARG